MLSDKEKKTLARYEKQLEGPKWKFVLAYGLAWTIILLLVLTPIEMVFQKTSLQEILHKAIWLRVILSIMLGLLYGTWLWNFLQVKCRKLRMKDSSLQ
jgi:tryptophan-rich sensory protein